MNWQTHNSCTISSTEQPMRCVATTSGRQHAHYFKNLYEISVFILSMCCLSLSSSLSFCFVLTIGVLVQINKKKSTIDSGTLRLMQSTTGMNGQAEHFLARSTHMLLEYCCYVLDDGRSQTRESFKLC